MCGLYSQGGLYSEVVFHTGLTVYRIPVTIWMWGAFIIRNGQFLSFHFNFTFLSPAFSPGKNGLGNRVKLPVTPES